MEIKAVADENREAVNTFLRERWFSTEMIVRNETIDLTDKEGLVIFEEGDIIGLLMYLFSRDHCEILSLDSVNESRGVGSALIDKISEICRERSCGRIRLITTNDNLKALCFYQKRGFHLVSIYPDSLCMARKLKPEIPLMGQDDIPLRDEIELEKNLA